MSTANMYEVIRAPRVSEKTARLQEVSNQYVFEVAKTATKADVKAAVEKIFDVKVKAVNVVNVAKAAAAVAKAAANAASVATAPSAPKASRTTTPPWSTPPPWPPRP